MRQKVHPVVFSPSFSLTFDHPTLIRRYPDQWAHPACCNGGDGLMHCGIYSSVSGRQPKVATLWHGPLQDPIGRTVNVSMLGVDTDPIEATPCHGPGVAGPWQHLPCTEARVRARSQSLADSIRGLHSDGD